MVELKSVIIAVYFVFQIVNGQNSKVKELYDCSSYLNKTITHSDLCTMLTKCTENVIRYQLTFDTAKHSISCCKTFSKKLANSHCKLECQIKCDNKRNKCKSESNTCLCEDGYTYDTAKQLCAPKCSTSCHKHGECIKPNVCRCSKGYKLSDLGDECLPDCSQICESNNGYCDTPNKCKCLPGYHLASNATDHCIPECFDSCESSRGACNLPNICHCPENSYFEKSVRKCVLKCSDRCSESGGTCPSPSKNVICACAQNQTWDDTANICACKEDFKFDENSKKCEPECHFGCTQSGGTCRTPNKCECARNYTYSAPLQRCELIQSDSCAKCVNNSAARTENGKCVCECNLGYKLVNNSCQPVCDTGCVNGQCVAPNICQCAERYVLSTPNVCELPCKYRCNNGKCLSDTECLCDEGYINNKTDRLSCVRLDKPVVYASPVLASFVFTPQKHPWLLIFCVALLVVVSMMSGAETWIHRRCNYATSSKVSDDNFFDVQYLWISNGNIGFKENV